MGARASLIAKHKLAHTWIVKSQQSEYNNNNINNANNNTNNNNNNIQVPKKQPRPHVLNNHNCTNKSESSRGRCLRTVSEPSLSSGGGESGGSGSRKCRHKRSRTPRHHNKKFGYQITDIDDFLTKASLETPGNIPVVLSSPCQLYLTQEGGYQEEIDLPLGMVVNAVFKNQGWLYVQTPHAEEGYVRYSCCLPLGILPAPQCDDTPPWETHSDIFPKPSGSRYGGSDIYSRNRCISRQSRTTESSCGEESVDRLYIRAMAQARLRSARTLLVGQDYLGKGPGTLPVYRGDIVVVVSSEITGWFYVRDRHGREGFIPSQCAAQNFI